MDYRNLVSRYEFFMNTIRIRMDQFNRKSFYVNGFLKSLPMEALRNAPQSRIEEFIYFNNEAFFSSTFKIEELFLCLRMMIETISLMCLFVHKDVLPEDMKKIHKEWNADKIIKTVEKYNKEYFPIPIKQHIDRNNITVRHTFDVEGAATKEELLQSYHRCGNSLHMGSLQDVENFTVFVSDIKSLGDSVGKLQKLLTHHRIKIFGEKKYLRCIMRSRQREGVSSVSLIDGDVYDTSPNERVVQV